MFPDGSSGCSDLRALQEVVPNVSTQTTFRILELKLKVIELLSQRSIIVKWRHSAEFSVCSTSFSLKLEMLECSNHILTSDLLLFIFQFDDDQVTIVPAGPMLFEGKPRWKQCWLKWEIMVYESGQRTWRQREREVQVWWKGSRMGFRSKSTNKPTGLCYIHSSEVGREA